MPSSYTSSLRLTLPVQGELSGSWGNTVNTGITQLVDTAVAGTANITMTAADYTLSNNNGATDEARAMFLVLQGTPGASYFVIVPTVSKLYFVTNNTGFAQRISTSTTPGSGISVPNGASMVLRCDGTNVVEVGNTFGTLIATNNLGVGTSSPGAKLHVAGTFRQNDATSTYGYTVTTASSKTVTAALFGGGYFAWQTNNSGTDQLTLDSSGNLGLGVTPSAWSGVVAMQLPTGAALTGFSNTTNLAQNAYYNGSWRYISTAAAALAQVTQGAHQWFTAPSGTAGNAITFTQAMTLDASGNLGVGAVSPGNRFYVNGPQGTPQILVTDGNVTVCAAYSLGTGASAVNYYGTASNHAQAFLVNNIERGRFNTAGALGVGTDTPRGDLDVGTPTATAITKSIHLGFSQADFYGFRIANTNTASLTYAGKLIFQRGNGSAWVDAMTIGDGGDVFVGTTNIPSSTNAGLVFALDANGTFLRNACTITATRTHFEFVNGNGTVGTISTNASATAFNTSSDRRLKTNIAPATDAGPVIDAIEVVQHDWKVGGHTRYGVIAQDLNAVAPEAVSAGDDGDEIEKTWGVDYSKLVPMLIKEIQSLRQRVSQLEQAA